ncbi:MAG: ABC transporter permease [Gemmatimonadales bacterium]
MNKIIAVIRREFVERVRTRAFVLGTILGPIFFGAMTIIPGLILSRQSTGQKLVVVDGTESGFGGRVEQALAAARSGRGDDAEAVYRPVRVVAVGRVQEAIDSLVPQTALSGKDVRAGSLDGILILDDSAVATGRVRYYGKNVGSMEDMRQLERTLSPLMITERLQVAGIDPATAMRAATPVRLDTRKVAEGKLTGQSGASTFLLAYAMGFILYLALLLYGSQVMTSVIEEKSNRIVEVLVSSLTPFQMMLGKVVGVGLVSLLQLSIWAGAFLFLQNNQARIMAALGAGAAGAATTSVLPPMPPMLIIVFLTFFILGFLFYSSGYAAVGSMVNTVQEAQQVQAPMMVMVIAGFFSAFALLRDPGSSFAKIVSLIPPIAPFAVPVRYSISPLPPGELILCIVAMVLGLLAMVWLTSRIYRVGILMYGKRASLKDVARWIRTT